MEICKYLVADIITMADYSSGGMMVHGDMYAVGVLMRMLLK